MCCIAVASLAVRSTVPGLSGLDWAAPVLGFVAAAPLACGQVRSVVALVAVGLVAAPAVGRVAGRRLLLQRDREVAERVGTATVPVKPAVARAEATAHSGFGAASFDSHRRAFRCPTACRAGRVRPHLYIARRELSYLKR